MAVFPVMDARGVSQAAGVAMGMSWMGGVVSTGVVVAGSLAAGAGEASRLMATAALATDVASGPVVSEVLPALDVAPTWAAAVPLPAATSHAATSSSRPCDLANAIRLPASGAGWLGVMAVIWGLKTRAVRFC